MFIFQVEMKFVKVALVARVRVLARVIPLFQCA
jgi:hypothetical protein